MRWRVIVRPGVLGRGHVLRLFRREVWLTRAVQAASAARDDSPGTIRKERGVAGCLLVAVASFAAGLCLGTAFFARTPDASTALYKRSNAFVRACETAGAEISRLRRAAFFIDDCSLPTVTPIFGEEGHLIVRRTVDGRADEYDGGRLTYSVKMDGRGIDKWRVIEIRRAPSQLTLDASLLPTKAKAAAER